MSEQDGQKKCGNTQCESQVPYFQGYCQICFDSLPENVQADLTRETQLANPAAYYAAQDAAIEFFLPSQE